MAVPTLDSDACSGCGVCVSSCTTEAIAMAGDKPEFDPAKCTACGDCVEACPCQAITLNK